MKNQKLFKNIQKFFNTLAELNIAVGAIVTVLFSLIAIFADRWMFIGAGVGLLCILLAPCIYAWGQLIEDVHNIASGKKPEENATETDLPEL